MEDKVNVLIFPAGTASALDIYASLKYSSHFDVFGASGKSDHAEFIYPKDKLFIGDLYITNPNFITEFNKVLEKFNIDYIIPTHETIASYLTKHGEKINAQIVCSPYETARIAENKRLTYEALKNFHFCPRYYQNINDITKYPVFLKPCKGAGSRGTHFVETKKELEDILAKQPDLLICEYLPGQEYTIDCFTNKDGELLFVGPRTRGRITMGMAFHSERAPNDGDFKSIAQELNNKFKFRGAWFYQVKEDEAGHLKLMEFTVIQAGTMTFHRQLGVNFAALSVFDAMGYDVKVLFNDYKLTLDRCLKNSFRLDYDYEKIYVAFEDTLIVKGKVNTTLMKLMYQGVNANKKIVLLTQNTDDLNNLFEKYRISKELFDEIIVVEPGKKKAHYIDAPKAVFIDSHFSERLLVKEVCKIPVFDLDAVDCLIDSRAI